MPSPYRSLDLQRLRQDLCDHEFSPRGGATDVHGVWSEAFAVRWDAGGKRPLPLARAELEDLVCAAAERCGASFRSRARPACEPDGSALGVGHGQKLWLATPLVRTPAECHEHFERAWLALRAALSAAHVDLVALGADPWRGPEDGEPPREAADQEREREFEASGPFGLAALRLAARTGVVLGWGSAVQAPLRWQAAQLAAPLAEALFAHSSVVSGVHPGTRGFAARAWRFAAPDRTAVPPGFAESPDDDRVSQYLDFALAASAWGLGTSFGAWLEHGVDGSFPERSDWRRHLATLAPRVRPDGLLELVCADAQPRAFALAPLAFLAALLGESASLQRVRERFLPRARDLARRYDESEREALAEPSMASDARAAVAIAADALLGAPGGWFGAPLRVTFVHFVERCTLRGRAPADELLEVFLRRGELDRAALYEHERRLLQPLALSRAG